MSAQPHYWWQDADAEDQAADDAEAAAQDALNRAHEAEIDRASDDVQRALEAYEVARRRVRLAPHGETQNRRAELRTANARVLFAELHLAELRRPDR